MRWPNWTAERAIGFVVGVGVMFGLVGAVVERRALPAFLGVALILVGISIPKVEEARRRRKVRIFVGVDPAQDDGVNFMMCERLPDGRARIVGLGTIEDL